MTPTPDTVERHVHDGEWCALCVAHGTAAPQPAEPGLRERIEALHPDGQPCVCVAAVLDMLDEVGVIGGSHWDSNSVALARDAEPVGLDVETLAEALSATFRRELAGVKFDRNYNKAVDRRWAETLAAEYEKLRRE